MTSAQDHLKKTVYNGARAKNLVITDAVLDRISYELSVIEKKEFTDYFIIYSLIIEICNELNLLRSYGRGFAADSLINYCLDITKINPIDENLMFENFIHLQQKNLPDVQIDIPRGQQKNVVELLRKKYPIYSSYFISFLPQEDTEYDNIIYNNTIYKKHPCGIIITPDKLINSTFEYRNQDFYLRGDKANDPIYNSKFDILELEYLNKLQLIVDEIGDKHHPYKLPLNDIGVLDFFATGDLDNIFQFDASWHKRIFPQFKPSSIHDLSIVNALFRPGLLEYMSFVTRSKQNNKETFYTNNNRVSEILSETYGGLIYKETYLKLSKEIAGIDFVEADAWRQKMMRDKSNNESINFSAVFAKGCKEHSTLNEDEIATLTNLIKERAGSTFPKSHSLSYAIIGYWGAYYKTHFRSQFDQAFSQDLKFEIWS